MEVAKQQSGIETTVSVQKARMSNSRMIFIGAMALAAFYTVWGIAKIIL